MFEFAHQGDLAQNSFAVSLILEDVFHSLDGDFATSALLGGQGNLAVAACSKKTFADVVFTNLPILELIEAKITTRAPASYIGGGRLTRSTGLARLESAIFTGCVTS